MFKNATSPAKLTFRKSIITDSLEMDCLLWLVLLAVTLMDSEPPLKDGDALCPFLYASLAAVTRTSIASRQLGNKVLRI